MRIILVALVLVSVALAGCAGDSDSPTTSSSSSSSSTTTKSPTSTTSSSGVTPPTEVLLLANFNFVECDGFRFEMSVPHDAAQATLPEGFTASTYTAPANTGTVGFEIYQCDNLTLPGLEIPDMILGRVFVVIDDPALSNPAGADRHEYILEMISQTDQVMTQLWTAAGYPTRDGTYVATPSPLPAGPGGVQAIAGYSLTTVADIPGAVESSENVAMWHKLPSKEILRWTTTEKRAEVAEGLDLVVVPTDSPIAGLFPLPLGTVTEIGTTLFQTGSNFEMSNLHRIPAAVPF